MTPLYIKSLNILLKILESSNKKSIKIWYSLYQISNITALLLLITTFIYRFQALLSSLTSLQSRWAQVQSTSSSKLTSFRSYFSNTSNPKPNSIKDFITKCMLLLGYLIGFVLLCFTLRGYKSIMICQFGMQSESAINYTTKIIKLTHLLLNGENGSANIIKVVTSRQIQAPLIGEKIILFDLLGFN